tara:strand:- start:835 stop:1098 length:264 start_codon:yes stop_codon:yes gene_type:complete
MKNLTEEELKSVQEIHNKYNKAKMDLGDHVLQRRALLQNIDMLKEDFAVVEKSLIEKYGKDSVIDLATGQVKSAEEVNENKEKLIKA